MAGPCGVTQQTWPYPCDIDAENGLRWDPVAQRLWSHPAIIADGVDVVFPTEFPTGGTIGLLQLSPVRTVRFYNPSSCMHFTAYVTHRYGAHIESDHETLVNVTSLASFAVNAPAPAPTVAGSTMSLVIPLTFPGVPAAAYGQIDDVDWFSPIDIPPGGFVETSHFMAVSGLRADGAPGILPTWGVACDSGIKISGVTTQA